MNKWPSYFTAAQQETRVESLGERARALQVAAPLNTPDKPRAYDEWYAGLSEEDRALFDRVKQLGAMRNQLYTRICKDIGDELKAKRELAELEAKRKLDDQADNLDAQ